MKIITFLFNCLIVTNICNVKNFEPNSSYAIGNVRLNCSLYAIDLAHIQPGAIRYLYLSFEKEVLGRQSDFTIILLISIICR